MEFALGPPRLALIPRRYHIATYIQIFPKTCQFHPSLKCFKFLSFKGFTNPMHLKKNPTNPVVWTSWMCRLKFWHSYRHVWKDRLSSAQKFLELPPTQMSEITWGVPSLSMRGTKCSGAYFDSSLFILASSLSPSERKKKSVQVHLIGSRHNFINGN